MEELGRGNELVECGQAGKMMMMMMVGVGEEKRSDGDGHNGFENHVGR